MINVLLMVISLYSVQSSQDIENIIHLSDYDRGQRVCCYYREGRKKVKRMMSWRQCRKRKGRSVYKPECQRKVCCKFKNFTTTVQGIRQCRKRKGRIVSMNECDGSLRQKVCCKWGDRKIRYSWGSRRACRDVRGRIVRNSKCGRRDY